MSGTVNEDIAAAKFPPDAIYERLQRFTIHQVYGFADRACADGFDLRHRLSQCLTIASGNRQRCSGWECGRHYLDLDAGEKFSLALKSSGKAGGNLEY
jgi:hypothetical protein